MIDVHRRTIIQILEFDMFYFSDERFLSINLQRRLRITKCQLRALPSSVKFVSSIVSEKKIA